MSRVTFENEQITLSVEAGTTILAAARKAGITIESPCNGAGVCGKCRLYQTQVSPVSALLIRKSVYDPEAGGDGFILACQSCIQGDLLVRLEAEKKEEVQILGDGRRFSYPLHPAVTKRFDEEAGETVVWTAGKETDREKGDTTKETYGVVVDIGTTTLVVSLVDLRTGRELSKESALNPQARHAQDVLSRISLAAEPGGLAVLYEGVSEEINTLIGLVCESTGVDRQQVYEVIYSGNTCMIHLATGTNPESLGRYPYIPEIRGGETRKAASLGLSVHPRADVYLPPIISAFVGPDITSGVLATQMEKEKGITLFVDIGTNGEMALAKDGRLSATSTAAGPAFEGMNIEFGMRAAPGAIERFAVGEDGEIEIQTIGGAKASGICGSGLMDIVAELVRTGVIKKNGKFAKKEAIAEKNLADRIAERKGKPVFLLTEDVWLTQKDIRQVQLAKGAIRTGIEFLLLSQKVTAAQTDRVLIAGSFGYHLKTESLIWLGLLPGEFADKVEYVGNTSKTGGEAFLLNTDFRRSMKELVGKIETVELSAYDSFQKVFVKSLGF